MNSTTTPPLLWSNGSNFLRFLLIYQTTLVTYLALPVSLIGIASSVTMSVADAVFLLASLLYLQIMRLCGACCRRIAYLLPPSNFSEHSKLRDVSSNGGSCCSVLSVGHEEVPETPLQQIQGSKSSASRDSSIYHPNATSSPRERLRF
ncbi:hypothetical protein EGR_05687 [Echinococcus granulosus]|uniref:Uncharacterized protein n=1 Tax=Echinococcus granulosus TaxID=6210 RepID=W6UEY6_ECHGR|nr:hypothetical protein EGR_05687 [Echinococcus granulosus]EUB59436.1 hypothetical protein EGR_05687 [Echinococcus granulosus]